MSSLRRLFTFVASAAVAAAALNAGDHGDVMTNTTAETIDAAICGYQATCSVGGVKGVCVSVSNGCCKGGTATAGLCPGSADIRCCTSPKCATPYGDGVCKQSSACAGRSVSGFCAGPSDVQCCIGSAPPSCRLGQLTGCNSHSSTRGLTNQIIAELGRMGYSYRDLSGSKWVRCQTGCSLQSSAADSLERAAQSVNDFITVNSAFRSSAEQFLLYRMYLRRQCGITLAAKPGQSNHEGGRAIDTSNYNYWRGVLGRFGWTHTYPSNDPVHFDYTGAANIASANLKAFQRLANRHTNARLAEDGVFGPATETALHNAPCNGW